MVLSWKKIRLNLKETFAISHGNFDFRDALLIVLTHAGENGYGECIAISYYQIDLNEFEIALKKISPQLENYHITTPEDFFIFLSELNLHPFLLSALDCAYWDLYGKLEDKSFSELAALSCNYIPYSSHTVSIGNVDDQLEKINGSNWPSFKVKCNSYNAADVAKYLETGKGIALDANASFTESDCCELENFGFASQLLYVEQPLAIGNYNSLKRESPVQWMADEDCQDISSLLPLQSHYSCINIKLMKCGGITPALKLIHKAKNLGYKVMIGCMTESSVGISAGIAVAPLCDFADLDGANLIANDYAEGSSVQSGKLRLSEKPGLGISLL